tara:strand:+ start:327 stop:491 length:165 start_codon:yes stop_codon:yes gene_type:complete
MTKREREKIKEAIMLIHDPEDTGDDYDGGMSILQDLLIADSKRRKRISKDAPTV